MAIRAIAKYCTVEKPQRVIRYVPFTPTKNNIFFPIWKRDKRNIFARGATEWGLMSL